MIVACNPLDELRQNAVAEIAAEFGLSSVLAKIMVSRGIDDVEKARRFLNPGKKNFYDPFLLSGMQSAVERITAARDAGERVVVFGDYDVDGICASTIMFNALKRYGLSDVFVVVPERSQGYGLSHGLVESVLERYFPDLIITVDCGISCKKEVGFISDMGVDVIVTDHHEIPEEIPDCIVVNCKLKGQLYPCDYLCGAGVAYKTAYALIGDKADDYLDLAALATIADSMILLDENRDIVYEGLRLIEKGGNRALSKLIEKSGLKEITSTGLAFTVAPRINAAGRMDDARAALSLMLESDPLEISEKCEILNEYNLQRQDLCDELLKSARQKLLSGGLHNKCIVLADEKWRGGLVGIVAAKLVEEYNRPVVLFTGKDGRFHGSVRSIDGVNIFRAVSACKEHLIDFGGHAQAAGITIAEDKIPLFEQCFSDYLDANYGKEQFEPKIEVESVITEPFTVELAEELSVLEPFGTGNKRPLFCADVDKINAYPIKAGSPHVVFKTEYLDFIYFNGERKLDVLNAPAKKRIAFEANLSTFNGRTYLKGSVKCVEYALADDERLAIDCFKNDLLSYKNGKEITEICDNELIAALASKKTSDDANYLYVCSSVDSLKKYGFDLSECSLYAPDATKGGSSVVLSLRDFSLRGFDGIVYLDVPAFNCALNGVETKYYVGGERAHSLSGLSVDRAVFAEVFNLLRLNRFYGNSSVDVAACIKSETLSKEQIVFCLEVFLELKIFSFVSGCLQLDRNVKSELSASELYRRVSEAIN